MKKLFICALALASVVACSKDDAGYNELESANKSVAITIANSGSATRAAGVTTPGTTGEACAEAKDLQVLFADASRKILKIMELDAAVGAEHAEYSPGTPSPGTDGKTVYTWHNVPAAVTNVAIIRDIDNVAKVAVGQSLDDVKAFASIEANYLTKELNQIFLYGENLQPLQDTGVHTTINGVEYRLWTGSVRVAPLFARLEITNIQCTDLGVTNTNDNPNDFGYDELVLNSLTWTGSKGSYSIDAAAEDAPLTTLYSQNNKDVINNTQKDSAKRVNYWTADGLAPVTSGVQSTVWSWNITPQTFTQMDLAFAADAYDYELADHSVALKVIDLSTSADATEDNNFEFSAENIYRVSLDFTEGDLTGKEGRCVQVTVEIAPWTVVDVHPVFGK